MPSIAKRRIITKTTTRRSNSGLASSRVIRGQRQGYAKDFMPLIETTQKLASKQDPFLKTDELGVSREMETLEPPYPYAMLSSAARSNSALNQSVEAYVVNIESYGYQLEFMGDSGKESLPRYQQEKKIALALLDHPTGDKSLRKIREDSRRDLEYLANRYFEIGRSVSGAVSFIEHVPTVSVRKTKKDKEATEYEQAIRTSDGRIETRKWWKHFRRYVQIGRTGKRVFFKEFGDPRPIDPANGKVNPALAIEDQATELYCDELYAVGCDYGIPRWIGALPDMLGLRESELVNLNFFRDNAIPAMAVLISGGALTEESYDKVVNVINAAKGQDSIHRIMILEAAADDTIGRIADSNPPAPRIELKPLTERQSDGLFKEYQAAGKRKIRSTMRLPALYVGDTEEYTKATAQSGIRVAETQVFSPERSRFDDFINRWVLPSLGVANWRFRSLGPTVYDPETLSTMVDRFGRHGAMTPNILIKLANQVLDVQINTITEKWGDVPYTYSLAMLDAGRQIDGFEEAFSELQDALISGDNSDPANPVNPSNDNQDGGNGQSAVKRSIRKQMIGALDDILSRVEEIENRFAA